MTPEQIQYIKDNTKTMSRYEIADKLGTTLYFVKKAIEENNIITPKRKTGVPRRDTKAMTKEQIKEINDCYPEFTIREICEKYNITMYFANKYVTKKRETKRTLMKFSEWQRDYIKDNRLKHSNKEIATELKVGVKRVVNFLNEEGLKLTTTETNNLRMRNKPNPIVERAKPKDDYIAPVWDAKPWETNKNLVTMIREDRYRG